MSASNDKNQHQDTDHTPDGERADEAQRQHERLCAYVFGEVDDAERARIEAELAASPELRAERERLEATISLVRDAIPSEEALSATAREELRGAAVRPSEREGAVVHPWPVQLARHPVARAAAVLAVLTGAATLAYWSEHNAAPTAVYLGEELAQANPAEERMDGADEERIQNELAPAKQATAKRDGERGLSGGLDAVRVDFARPPLEAPEAEEARRSLGQTEATELFFSDAGVDADHEELSSVNESLKEADALLSGGNMPAPSTLPESGEVVFDYGAAAFKQPTVQDQIGGVTLEALGADPSTESLSALGYLAGGEAGAADTPVDLYGWTAEELAKKRGRESKATRENKVMLARTAPVTGGGAQGDQGGEVFVGARLHRLSGGPSTPGPAGPSTPGPPSSSATPTRGGGGGGGTDPAFRAFTATETRSEDALSLGSSARRKDKNTFSFENLTAALELDEEIDGFFVGKVELRDERFGRELVGGRRAVELVGPEERRAYSDEIIRFCRVQPDETPSMMFFRCWGDNPFELAQLDPLSTFSADVDTASYTLARNYLSRGVMPTKEQIRTEEFVNYFDSGVAAPPAAPFALHMDMAPSLFGKNGEWMLRVVLRGKEVDKADRQNLALTFVVDTSGSMKQENRMELVKHALRLLVGEMFPADSIAIVAFSTEARVVLPMTSASNKGVIESAIYGLTADGSTNADAGLRVGYEIAGAGLTPGANNRVVLLSDGVANVGNTDETSILASVEHQRSKGIYLNTIGVGMGNHNDALLEQLADKGDGICNYIDTPDEAYKVLVENFTGAFQPIARDVKIQVEFDPAQVQSYRLLGYENRTVADVDFRNDAVDAGEVGAGHQVTALYELVRMPTATNDGPLATARVRYKPPFAIDRGEMGSEAQEAAEKAQEIERAFAFREVATAFQGTEPGYQRAVLIGQLAEFLRRSVHARGDSYATLVQEALRLQREATDEDFDELCQLLVQHQALITSHLPADDEIARAIEELTRHHYLRGQLDQLHREVDELSEEVLEEIRSENESIENRIRELIERQLESALQPEKPRVR
ncbi:MAG: von Willebrand factor type A domain-containing protein [Planctomycetota bacterium]